MKHVGSGPPTHVPLWAAGLDSPLPCGDGNQPQSHRRKQLFPAPLGAVHRASRALGQSVRGSPARSGQGPRCPGREGLGVRLGDSWARPSSAGWDRDVRALLDSDPGALVG